MFEPDEFDADSDADAQENDENDVDDPDDFDAFSDSDAEDEAAEWIAEVGGPGGKRGTDRLEAGEGQGEEIDDFSVGQPRAGMGATGGRKTSAGPDSAADNSGSVGAEAQNPTPAGRGNAEQEDRESITSEDGTSTQSSLGTERSEEEGSGGDVSMSDDTRDKAEGAEDGTPKSRGAKLASPARSLRGMGSASKKGKADNRTAQGRGKGKGRSIGPSKTKVVIKDAAWSTWWALLYWVSFLLHMAKWLLRTGLDLLCVRRPSDVCELSWTMGTGFTVAKCSEPKGGGLSGDASLGLLLNP